MAHGVDVNDKTRRHRPVISEGTKILIHRLESIRHEAALCGLDVERQLDALDAQRGNSPGWRTSVAALLATLGCDSTLKQRRELAKDLGFTGNLEAPVNLGIWLHAEVMTYLTQSTTLLPLSVAR